MSFTRYPLAMLAGLVALLLSVAAQEPAVSPKEQLSKGGVALAQQRLAANPGDELGWRLLEFVELIAPETGEAAVLRQNLVRGAVLAPPAEVVQPADYAVLLANFAGQDRNRVRALILFALAAQVDPGNSEAAQAVTAAKLQGQDISLERLIRDRRYGVLSETVDFVTPAETLYRGILEAGLEDGQGPDPERLKEFAQVCRRRAEARESDAELAGRGLSLVNELLGHLEARRKALDDLDKARNWEPGMRGGDANKVKAETEAGRERRAGNVTGTWQRYAATAAKGSSGQLLQEIQALAKGLSQRSETGRGELAAASRAMGRAVPAAREKAPPPSEPAVEVVPQAKLPPPPPIPAANVGKPAEYDPDPGPSPAELALPLREIGNWLRVQQERMGATFATRIYGKLSNSRVVLYLEVNRSYTGLPKDERLQLAETIWRFWAERCLMNRVAASKARIHLVLVSNGKIVASSKPERGNEITLN